MKKVLSSRNALIALAVVFVGLVAVQLLSSTLDSVVIAPLPFGEEPEYTEFF